jgi:hypothetical protein
MESMGKKPQPRHAIAPEFRAKIVKLCQRGDRSVGQVGHPGFADPPRRPLICSALLGCRGSVLPPMIAAVIGEPSSNSVQFAPRNFNSHAALMFADHLVSV